MGNSLILVVNFSPCHLFFMTLRRVKYELAGCFRWLMCTSMSYNFLAFLKMGVYIFLCKSAWQMINHDP